MKSPRYSRLARTISVLITICLFSFPARAKYSGGAGEPNAPYQIATSADLIALGEDPNDYDKHFILTADIDLYPNLPGCKVFDKAVVAPDLDPNFTIVAFEGAFDGQGHIIRGLTIAGGSYSGLFGRLSHSAAVLNLELEDLNVVGGDYVGGLAGMNEGLVINCHSTGLVRGNNYVGGLVGYNYHTILNSRNEALVRGQQSAGGLTGHNNRAVLNCLNKGSIESSGNVGGLVGENYGTVSNCYNSGPVTGFNVVGGLVGVINFGIVSNSYSTGPVTGVIYVGGMVGTNGGIVSNTYSTGTVIGTGAYCIGGLVGNNGGTISNSFWDMTTSGMKTGQGGTGLSTAQMQDPNTFLDAGWDFLGERGNGICETWMAPISGAYPKLSTFNGYVPPTPTGSGTRDDPYIVETPEELAMIGYRPTANYRLAADISLSEMIWSTAIVPTFIGSLDGQGHIIKNMTLYGGGYLGLFGYLSRGAKVSGLGLENVRIVNNGNYVGSLAGRNSFGTVSSCYSTGSISGTGWYVGGLVGYNDPASTITNSCSANALNGTGLYYYVGGLVGYNQGNISNSFSSESVSGSFWLGGLVGRNNNATVSNCYSTGSVSGTHDYIGGLIGENYSSTISNSYSTGSVTGRKYVGGLVGQNNRTVANSFWDMLTSGQTVSAGGSGLSTTEMQTISTYLSAGWDMEKNWMICEGQDYPRLRWEERECP